MSKTWLEFKALIKAMRIARFKYIIRINYKLKRKFDKRHRKWMAKLARIGGTFEETE